MAEQPGFKPTICWNYCVLLKQEGGSSLTAALGPTSLTGTSLCIQQHSLLLGFTSEKLGLITQIMMPHAAFPECLTHRKCQLSGNCGAGSPLALLLFLTSHPCADSAAEAVLVERLLHTTASPTSAERYLLKSAMKA